MKHLQDELNRQMRQARERERDADKLLEDQRREAERQTQRAVAEVGTSTKIMNSLQGSEVNN